MYASHRALYFSVTYRLCIGGLGFAQQSPFLRVPYVSTFRRSGVMEMIKKLFGKGFALPAIALCALGFL